MAAEERSKEFARQAASRVSRSPSRREGLRRNAWMVEGCMQHALKYLVLEKAAHDVCASIMRSTPDIYVSPRS